MQKTEKIWMNGKMVKWDDAKVHVLTHALHYGTGFFEGIRCYNTVNGPAIFRLEEHVKRFFRTAKIYDMKIPFTQAQLMNEIKGVVKANGLKECYIRPVGYYGYGEMGLDVSNNLVEVAIAAWPWGALLGDEALKKGVRCKISSWARIDSRSMPALAKSAANYANAVLAKMEVTKLGFDEAILLNIYGQLTEGPGENVFIVSDGTIATPPLSAGILEGITRDSVMTIAKDQKMPLVEKNVMREELYTCDEAFFAGTAVEITPIREIDGRVIGRGTRGPVTEKLQRLFFDVVKGKNTKYRAWLDPV
ncbi:MAG TPA: branched-chain amino acid transaminase [Candidatus Bathyarchaeia archaeon]|nr:MAG: branched chain amino acid aminotransferase [Candidatus Bathyarchaeota archaeon RBG_16_48_13]HJX22913.1 branched-chain amino acid transaminase [Candidatus Bathyarchaeia archaeon]